MTQYSLLRGDHGEHQLRELPSDTKASCSSADPNTGGSTRHISVDEALRTIGLGCYHLQWLPVLGLASFTQSSMLALSRLVMVPLQCQWDMGALEETFLFLAIFLGACPGAVISGILADKKGRKFSLILGQLLLLIFTVLSAASMNIYFFSFCYALVGLAVGILTVVTMVQFSEISPPNFRSYSVTLLMMCWVFGNLYSSLICYLLLNVVGWEIVTFVVAIPHLIASILVLLADETPKYLAMSGHIGRAEHVLGCMAHQNNAQLDIEGKLVVRIGTDRGSMGEVVTPEYRKELGLLSLIIFCAGVIIFTSRTTVPRMLNSNFCGFSENENAEKCILDIAAVKQTSMITTAEVIMLPIFAFGNELLGRIKTIRILAAILFLTSFLLVFCIDNAFFVTCVYIQQGTSASLLLILFIYTPEAFPTNIRGVAAGMTLAFYFLGAVLSTALVYPTPIREFYTNVSAGVTCAALALLLATVGLKRETVACDLS